MEPRVFSLFLVLFLVVFWCPVIQRMGGTQSIHIIPVNIPTMKWPDSSSRSLAGCQRSWRDLGDLGNLGWYPDASSSHGNSAVVVDHSLGVSWFDGSEVRDWGHIWNYDKYHKISTIWEGRLKSWSFPNRDWCVGCFTNIWLLYSLAAWTLSRHNIYDHFPEFFKICCEILVDFPYFPYFPYCPCRFCPQKKPPAVLPVPGFTAWHRDLPTRPAQRSQCWAAPRGGDHNS